MVQQLRFHRIEYDGFYLAPPKAGSVGDVDLDDEVVASLAAHVKNYPPVFVDLADITAGTPDPGKKPKRRRVRLMFTDESGRSTTNVGRRCSRSGAGRPAGPRTRRSTPCATTSPRR